MRERTKILFRCDGGPQIGLGHVIRSCALASMLSEEFDCRFFIRNPSDALRRYVEDAGFPLTALQGGDLSASPAADFENEARSWAEELNGDEILVLDGYAFDTRYQQLLKKKRQQDRLHRRHSRLPLRGRCRDQSCRRHQRGRLFAGTFDARISRYSLCLAAPVFSSPTAQYAA